MTAADLCLALVAAFAVPEERACAVAPVLIVEAGPDAVLLSALISTESPFDFRSVDKRTGACGIGSVLYSKDRAVQARRCRRVVASLDTSVRAAVVKLRQAWAYCTDLGGRPVARRHGLTRCTVAGYIAGPRGVRALGRGDRLVTGRVRARIEARDRLLGEMGKRPGAVTARGAAS